MDRRPLVDPEEGRTEALVVGSMALAGAIALIVVAALIGTVRCPDNGVVFVPVRGIGIAAGAVIALAALGTLLAARTAGRHVTALVVGMVLVLADALLLLLVVRYEQHPTSGCYTF